MAYGIVALAWLYAWVKRPRSSVRGRWGCSNRSLLKKEMPPDGAGYPSIHV